MVLLVFGDLSFGREGDIKKLESFEGEWKIRYETYHRRGFIPMSLEKKMGESFEETYIFDEGGWTRKKGGREIEKGSWYFQGKKLLIYKKNKFNEELILGFAKFETDWKGKKNLMIERMDFDFHVRYILERKQNLKGELEEFGTLRKSRFGESRFGRIQELLDTIND